MCNPQLNNIVAIVVWDYLRFVFNEVPLWEGREEADKEEANQLCSKNGTGKAGWSRVPCNDSFFDCRTSTSPPIKFTATTARRISPSTPGYSASTALLSAISA